MASHQAAIRRLQEEQGNGPLPDPTNKASMARRRLLHGETIGPEDANITPSHLAQLVSELRRYGFDTERFGTGDTSRIRLTNPDHVPEPIETKSQHRKLRDSPLLRALLGGAAMTAPEAASKYNCRPEHVRSLIRRLEDRGYAFHKLGSPTVYSLADGPVQEIELRSPELPLVDPSATRPKAPNSSTRFNGIGSLAPAPALGMQLRVQMLALGGDGEIQIAVMADDGQTWLCTIDGYHST